MRPTSLAVKWMSVFSIVLAVFALANLASAQSGTASKRKVSQHALPVVAATKAKPGKKIAPPVTTDTWTGTAGDGNWNTSGNWNNGLPGGDNVVIGLTTAATNVNASFSIGTLTLSNAGDSAAIANNVTLTAGGNISNAGTISLNSGGNVTVLDIGANLTLSGAGSVVLGSGGPNQINGASGTVLTNSSNIVGGGGSSNDNVGANNLVIANAAGGTINANVSGLNLYVQAGGASTNAGTIEATNGGTLLLYGQSWTQSGAGTISAGNGSAVVLQQNASVTGGTLNSSGTGVVYGGGGYNVSLSNITNSGTYDLQNNNQTFVSGTITNNGTINLQSGGNNTNLNLTANTTLAGTGTVVLGGGGPNFINGTSGVVLTNNSTITGGAGSSNANIGYNLLGLVNNGTINANVSGTNLYVQPLSTSTSVNTKTLEATSGGTLVMYGGAWTNTGGTISAAAGSAVVLDNYVSITGGTLTSTGTGVIYNGASNNVYLTGLTISNGTTYDIQNNGLTTISGTITNNGTINLQSGGNNTYLDVVSTGTESATLAGTGTVVLGTGGPNIIGGPSGGSLTNQETITGVGNIGQGNLTLTNSSTGIINANISPTVSASPLYVQPGTGGVTNAGTLEATNGGTLYLYGGAITNTGTIQAVGSDTSNHASTVLLGNSVSITGGTLTTTGAGVIDNVGGNLAYLTGVTISTGSTYNILNNGETVLSGTITNNGTINLLSGGNNTELALQANTTLTGTGSVNLGSGGPNYIAGTAGGFTLTNAETIQGAGNIGESNLTLVNNGTIDASLSGTSLVLQPAGTLTNTKTLEATNGGTLVFNSGTYTQTGVGTITAATGSAVDLYNNASIVGGTLTTTGTGVIYNQGGYVAYLTGLTISTGSTYDIQSNAETVLSGTITNNGTINVQSAGNNTVLAIGANTTLTGTGNVTMGNGGPNYIYGAATGLTLTNAETIQGAGNIGNGNLALVNNGTIDANVTGGTLTLLLAGTSSTNTKTMEATNGGTLTFNTTLTQMGVGTITAATGSAVDLFNNASITGGTLTTSGTGVIYDQGGYFAYLTNLTNSGTYQVQNNAETVLTGTITNNGQIQINSGGNNTVLAMNGAVTLKGTGSVVLGSGGPNFIEGTGTTPTLTSFNTISGVGNIGNGGIGFTNSGTLNANVSGQALAINVDASGFTNYNGTTDTLTGGTYIANPGNITYNFGNTTGITTLAASVTEEAGGQFINTDGGGNALANLTSITSAGSLTTNVTFTDAGAFSNAGSLTILGGTTFNVGSLTQISGGSLTAGTYVLDSNLNITGAAQTITTNAANVTLAGGTIHNTSNNSNAFATLATNTGKFALAGTNTTFTTTAASFSNTGTLTIGASDTFTAPALTQISGSTLSGGTFVVAGNLDLTTAGINITTNSSTLTLEGTGAINSNNVDALTNLASNTKSLTLANNANFTTSANFSNTGTLTVNSGSTFTVTGTLSQYHSATNTLQGGTYVVGGTLALAAGANGIETDSANVTLSGTGTFKNTTAGSNANALVNLNTIGSTGALTLSSNANFTTVGNFTNSGKLTINSGSTFGVTGTLSNLSSGTLTGGTYTVGGTLQLASANGGITTNAATLTLTGTSAKILDGSSNALSTFNNNTGTFALASAATLTTASSNFTNAGTVTVAKGTTLTVGGTGHSYSQTAGTTNADGILSAGTNGTVALTGGTIQGSGTVKGNTTNTSGTFSAGDAGKAGLLTITGNYTQLSSGTLNSNIGGTTVSTQYSELKVSGTASLGGTLAVTLINSFTPAIGNTFTVLTATSVTGTFTNTTIAINSGEHFVISYTSTSVVLTVVSGPASVSGSTGAQPAAALAVAGPKKSVQPPSKSTVVSAKNTLRHGVTGISKRVEVASLGHGLVPVSGAVHATPRIWEHVPVTASWDHMKAVTVAQVPRAVGVGAVNVGGANSDLAHHVNVNGSTWTGTSHAVPVKSPVTGWSGMNNSHRLPARILPPSMPVIR